MKFGTSGLRGLVTDLQGHMAVLYATAFARHLLEAGYAKPKDKVFVAGDHRPSSPDIAASCIGALSRAGLTPVDCGTIPTPALAFYAMSHHGASLMVTGSHIPADRNGIKFYRPDGEIDKADETAITRIAGEITDRIIDLTPGMTASEEAQAQALFLARNRTLLPQGALSGLKVGVYQHSTVARDGLVDVITGYGAEVIALGRSDTFIPVDTEAVSSETIELMRGWVREHGLDAIVSADGDGDRPLVADETGLPLRGDLLGLIATRYLGADVVVTPVTSNSGLEAAGSHAVVRTRVGSPYVIEAMKTAAGEARKGVIGFEANGGTLTGSDFLVSGTTFAALATRDSFLPVLATLLLRKQEGRALSDVVRDFGLPVALADRLENYPVETSAALMAHLRASPDNLSDFLAPLGTVAAVSDIDGLRLTMDDGRVIHLRPSGNAPEMRCYVEAKDEAGAQSLLRQGLDLLRDWAGRA